MPEPLVHYRVVGRTCSGRRFVFAYYATREEALDLARRSNGYYGAGIDFNRSGVIRDVWTVQECEGPVPVNRAWSID